jgi:hypothetical protein
MSFAAVCVTVACLIIMGSFCLISFNLRMMVDEYENVYTWTTAARQLVEGNTYLVRGRVKGHDTYKGTKQTALTRCMIGE